MVTLESLDPPGLLVMRGVGPVTSREVVDAAWELMRLPPSVPLLIDARGVTRPLTHDEMNDIGAALVQFPRAVGGPGRAAFVVASEVMFGTSRIMTARFADSLARDAQVFRDIEAALRFLGVEQALPSLLRQLAGRPEPVEQRDVRGGLDPIHHERPAVVDPARTELDVELLGEPRGDALAASRDVVDPDRVAVARLAVRDADRPAVRAEHRQSCARHGVLPEDGPAFTVEQAHASREDRGHDPGALAVRARDPVAPEEPR